VTIRLISSGFYLYDTLGLGLAEQMEAAHQRGCMISLLDFILDAVAAGWTAKKARRVVEEACLDVFGKIPKGVF
jgi:hypothetical protein